jgi:hypothetical protein
MEKYFQKTYPTFVYEYENGYIADCTPLNIATTGASAIEAVENLKIHIKNVLNHQKFHIQMIFQKN